MRIFISYSRKDETFARHLAADLDRLGADVWIDVDDIRAGLSWADSIQEGLDACEVMIVIISPESMASKNVADEWQYYVSQDRAIIPVLLREARVHYQLQRLQYIDFLNQNYTIAFAQLHTELRRKGIMLSRLTSSGDSVEIPRAQHPLPVREDPRRTWIVWSVGVIATLVIVAVIVLALNNVWGGGEDVLDPDSIASTVIALNNTQTVQAWTPPPSNTPTSTPNITQTVRVAMDRQYTQTAEAHTGLPTVTQMIGPTLTRTPTSTSTRTSMPTATQSYIPTPDINYGTENWFVDTQVVLQMDLDLCRTPSVNSCDAGSVSGGVSGKIIGGPTPADEHWWWEIELPDGRTGWIAQVLLTDAVGLANSYEEGAKFIGGNDDWTPIIEEFDGIEMVLVPAGCFMMGSDKGESNEKPVHEACFDEPFWIDRTEVTNAQYGSEGTFFGDNRPRESVSWHDARDFCTQRGARLLTEAEWEYAARGPDALIYPWGDVFDPDKVVYSGNSGSQTADVGSKLSGASWVGALDMSGNVWEWVADKYRADYSSAFAPAASINYFVMRGGSWYYSPEYLRAAYRYWGDYDSRSRGVGFRCARDVD